MTEEKVLRATHAGKLEIGEITLPCAVLEDGTRIISRSAIFRAFGRTKRGRKKDEIRVPNMPSFIDANNLQPFIDNDLRGVLTTIEYINVSGHVTDGYKAEILPLLCDVYLSARVEKVLTKLQIPLATAAEILVRSLSKVGIIALIDEATGYQEERNRNELQKILAAYISKELLPWTKRFPDEFYKQLFRLKGWKYPPATKGKGPRGPRYAGKITNQLVYEKLPPGVLEELQHANPVVSKGRRKYRHHQLLTEDIGNPHLEKHILSVITLMHAARTWAGFKRLFERVFPPGGSYQLEIFETDDVD